MSKSENDFGLSDDLPQVQMGPRCRSCPMYEAWKRKFIQDLESQYKGGKADGI